MKHIPVSLSVIYIIYLRELHQIIPNHSIDYLVTEVNDSTTYCISELPIIYNGNISEMYDRLAYDYQKLPDTIKSYYYPYCHQMIQNEDGTYYASIKETFDLNKRR